jgi:hypothetical protein
MTGDILRSPLNVLHCAYNVVQDLSLVPASNHPMCIPEGFFAEGSQSRDVFISGHHRFFTLNETTVGIQVFKLLPDTNTLTMDKALEVVGSDVLKYYHLEEKTLCSVTDYRLIRLKLGNGRAHVLIIKFRNQLSLKNFICKNS